MTRLTPKAAVGITAAALLVGYADLWRGGETISAVLLTLGYVILVPVAIVTMPRQAQPVVND